MLVLLAAAMVHMALRPLMHKPLLTDEVESVKVALAIGKLGVPVIEVGSEKQVIFHHSRVYHHMLATIFGWLGEGEFNARLLGLCCYLVNALLVWLITTILAAEQKILWAPFWATLFYLISPLAVQGSVLVDIDTTILTVCSTLFLYYLISTMRRPLPYQGVTLGALWGLCLMVKGTTSLLLGPLAALAQIHGDEAKKRWILASKIIFTGLLIYVTFSLIYSHSRGLDPLWPITHKVTRIFSALSGEDSHLIISWVKRTLRIALWISPFAFLLYLAALRDSWQSFLKQRRLDGRMLLALYTLIVLVVYIALKGSGYGFPRYHLPMLPAMCALIGLQIGQLSLTSRQIIVALVLVVLQLAYYFQLNTDFFYAAYTFHEHTILAPESMPDAAVGLAMTGLAYLFPFFGAGVVFYLLRLRGVALFMLAAVVVFVPLSIWQIFVQKNNAYATNYMYGERGIREAAVFLRDTVESDERIICPTDLAYYLERKQAYLSASEVFSDNSVGRLLADRRIRALAFRDGFFAHVYFGNIIKKLQPILDTSFELHRIGSFFIYLRQ
jgi:hypothetical protein